MESLKLCIIVTTGKEKDNKENLKDKMFFIKSRKIFSFFSLSLPMRKERV